MPSTPQTTQLPPVIPPTIPPELIEENSELILFAQTALTIVGFLALIILL